MYVLILIRVQLSCDFYRVDQLTFDYLKRACASQGLTKLKQEENEFLPCQISKFLLVLLIVLDFIYLCLLYENLLYLS